MRRWNRTVRKMNAFSAYHSKKSSRETRELNENGKFDFPPAVIKFRSHFKASREILPVPHAFDEFSKYLWKFNFVVKGGKNFGKSSQTENSILKNRKLSIIESNWVEKFLSLLQASSILLEHQPNINENQFYGRAKSGPERDNFSEMEGGESLTNSKLRKLSGFPVSHMYGKAAKLV